MFQSFARALPRTAFHSDNLSTGGIFWNATNHRRRDVEPRDVYSNQIRSREDLKR